MSVVLGEKPVVFGKCGNKLITLRDGVVTYCGNEPTGYECSMRARAAFIGAHFRESADAKFKDMVITYSLLDQWASFRGFDAGPEKDSDWVIKYKAPAPVRARVDDALVEISATAGLHMSNYPQQASIKPKTYALFKSQNAKTFEQWQDIILHLNKFFSLATMVSTSPLTIEGRGLSEPRDCNEGVKIFSAMVKRAGTNASIAPFKMLFSLPDITEVFESVLRNWFVKKQLLQPTTDLFYAVINSQSMYLETQFISLAQALDSYLRRTGPNLEIPEVEHNKRIEAILEGMTGAQRSWLEGKLKYSNLPSFYERMQHVLADWPGRLDAIIGDKEVFSHRIRDTRDYLTHYDARLKRAAASGHSLYHLTARLRWVIVVLLMKEMSFSHDLIEQLVLRHRDYLHTLHFDSKTGL